MGPVRQNPIQRTVSLFICVCIALCTIVAHNIGLTQRKNEKSFPVVEFGHTTYELTTCIIGTYKYNVLTINK